MRQSFYKPATFFMYQLHRTVTFFISPQFSAALVSPEAEAAPSPLLGAGIVFLGSCMVDLWSFSKIPTKIEILPEVFKNSTGLKFLSLKNPLAYSERGEQAPSVETTCVSRCRGEQRPGIGQRGDQSAILFQCLGRQSPRS